MYQRANPNPNLNLNPNLVVNPHSTPGFTISNLNQLEPLLSALDKQVDDILNRVKMLNAQSSPNKPIYTVLERDYQQKLIQDLEMLTLQYEQQLSQLRSVYLPDGQAYKAKKISSTVTSYLSSGLSTGFAWMKAAAALPATLWYRQPESNIASPLDTIEIAHSTTLNPLAQIESSQETNNTCPDAYEQVQFLKHEKDLVALYDFLYTFKDYLNNVQVQSQPVESPHTAYTTQPSSTQSYQSNPRPYDMAPPSIYIDPRATLAPQKAYTPMANASASVTSQTTQAAQSAQPATIDYNYGNYV